MRLVLTEEVETRIVEAYKRLETYQRVADEIGCSINTVQRVMVRRGENPGQGKHTPGNNGGGSAPKISDDELIEKARIMTRRQIATAYGMNVTNVSKRMARLGIHAVYQKPTYKKPTPRPKNTGWRWTPIPAEMVERAQNGRFELVEHNGARMRVRCKKCGGVSERAQSTVRQKNITCDFCKAAEEERKELENSRQEFVNILRAIAEKAKPRICPACGATFYSEVPTKKYCSKRCKEKYAQKKNRKAHRKKAGHYSDRARKYGCEYESGITLKKIFNRDKGICQICGKPVDWNDHSWGESFGAMYPTIDHIKALANGGGHTWDNVQLAHAICNSLKRDTA